MLKRTAPWRSMAAALVCMVARLTIGRKKYAAVEGQMQSVLDRAVSLIGCVGGELGIVDETARELDVIYRIHASSSVRVSVRSSRYLTITGVASDKPHSRPAPTVTARAPGTTTAPSGITSGSPASGLMMVLRGRSYTGVEPVSTAGCTSHVIDLNPNKKSFTIGWYQAGTRRFDFSGLYNADGTPNPQRGAAWGAYGVGAVKETGWIVPQGGNTWAAYQCYGDPNWTLRLIADRPRALTPPDVEFAAVAHVDRERPERFRLQCSSDLIDRHAI